MGSSRNLKLETADASEVKRRVHALEMEKAGPAGTDAGKHTKQKQSTTSGITIALDSIDVHVRACHCIREVASLSA